MEKREPASLEDLYLPSGISKVLVARELVTRQAFWSLHRAFIGYITEHADAQDGATDENAVREAAEIKRWYGLIPGTAVNPQGQDFMMMAKDGSVSYHRAAKTYVYRTLLALAEGNPSTNEVTICRESLLRVFADRKFSMVLSDQPDIANLRGRIAAAATISALLTSNTFKVPRTINVNGKAVTFRRA